MSAAAVACHADARTVPDVQVDKTVLNPVVGIEASVDVLDKRLHAVLVVLPGTLGDKIRYLDEPRRL